MRMLKTQKLKEVLLEDVSIIKEVVSQLNSWNGCLDHLDVHENDEEFFNVFFEGKPNEAVRASFYGDYRYMDEYVRFNGYGNLESLTDYQYEQELKDYIDEIIDNLIENKHKISLDVDLEELLEEEEE
ncbi:hypothetical protein PQE75_gp040 [Bacillus phage vB_BcoS-136]|uniref:Uncharacterized protein n=1 Tax=Bacillus phage vB_BcoS-136 TaxID=2419619 RepID=A0A3G3BVA1_9CAUD|nr:hypothetical protein PQE75_gp040 [Bacillus phage vB_BcoS-136]AYP68172.1 hypothetical protein vBBcoS136_00040 [Bacillus phage vB_BcoS-136]